MWLSVALLGRVRWEGELPCASPDDGAKWSCNFNDAQRYLLANVFVSVDFVFILKPSLKEKFLNFNCMADFSVNKRRRYITRRSNEKEDIEEKFLLFPAMHDFSRRREEEKTDPATEAKSLTLVQGERKTKIQFSYIRKAEKYTTCLEHKW